MEWDDGYFFHLTSRVLTDNRISFPLPIPRLARCWGVDSESTLKTLQAYKSLCCLFNCLEATAPDVPEKQHVFCRSTRGSTSVFLHHDYGYLLDLVAKRVFNYKRCVSWKGNADYAYPVKQLKLSNRGNICKLQPCCLNYTGSIDIE